jgi:hypothetical protein
MSKLAKLAGTLPFAHLLGVKAAAEVDDDEKKKDKEDAKAESEDDEAEASAESDDDKKPEDKEKDKEAKGTKAEKEEDDDDEEKMQAGAQRERARCAAIVAHGINTCAIRQACAYAFDTNMSAETAIATLNATAADRKAPGSTLARRMAEVTTPKVGAAAEAPNMSDPGVVAQMVIAAAAKARGQKA